MDFHPYCHAVVHWNLPANPADLEQREGRVHRYKRHAIRRNVARKHGPAHACEIDRLAMLRQSLAVYRMVFGQARQEELVEYLRRHVPESEIANVAEMMRIDLGPAPAP